MNLLVVSNLYPPHVLGGYEILCEQVCRGLARRGHTVSILTSNHGLDQASAPTDEDAVERTLHLYLPFGQPAALLRRQRRRVGRHNERVACEVIERLRPDLIFIWSQLRLTLGAARAAQASSRPTVFTFNDMHPAGFLPAARPSGLSPRAWARWFTDLRIFNDITWRGLYPKHTTCISRRLKNDLVARGLPIENSRVIYQGIPIEQFPAKENVGHLQHPMRALYTGQIHDYKGVHTLLKAVAALGARRGGDTIALSVAGDGPESYKRRLCELAAASPAPIGFLGKIDHDRMAEVYRAHDVFIFPSEWPEPFGLTHLEAMASGLPVVSTTDGGHGEFLEDDVNCLAFPAGDAAALSERIERLMDRPDLARRLALEGRRVVEKRFSVERYIDQLDSFLQECRRDANM